MEEVHAKSQQDLQLEVRQLQKAVKQLGEARTEQRSGTREFLKYERSERQFNDCGVECEAASKFLES